RAALRSALLGLVTVVDNLTVRRPAARDETDVAVLRPLIDARLVTAGRDTVEITHEALLTSWPRLAGWLTEAREEILLRQRLAQAAADWSAAGEDPDVLYRGARLATAREWATGRTDVSGPQQRFLAAGAAAAEAELLAQRRGTRRLLRLATGLAVALLLAVVGGLIALNQRGYAQQKGQEALSRQLAAESRTTLVTDQPDAVRKALAAWAAAHTAEARGALLSTEQTSTLGQLGTEPRAQAVAVSLDGRLVAVGQVDGRIQLWNSATLQQVGPEMRHPAERLMSLRFSPDGRYLASGSIAVNGVVLWDVPSGRLVRRLPGFGAVAWLPDSSAVLASRLDGVPVARLVGAWDPDDGRLTGTITSAIRGALSMSVSPDAKYLALAGANGGQLLRRADQRSMATLPGVEDVVFAADDTLAVRTADGVVTRWDARTGRKIATLTDPADGTTGGRMAITPDGTVLVQGDDVRKIHSLKLDGGGPRPLLTGFRGSANDLSLSADGHLLAVAGVNSPPTLFRVGVDRLPHPQVVGYLAYDRTGTRLATGSHDPVIRIWDPNTSNLTSTIKTRSTEGPLGIAYAPDGTIAAGSAEGTVQIYAPDGRLRGTVRADKTQHFGRPVFSPDGSLFAVPVDVRPSANPTAKTADNRQDEAGLIDVLVWDTATLAPRARLETPGHQSIAMAFTPDGSHLIAATNRSAPTLAATGTVQDGAVWSWRTADMSLAARHNLPGVAVADVKVSPDGKYVALAAATRRVQLFTADRLEPAGAIARHPFELTRLAYSPDGTTLATASSSDDDIVRLWDTRTTNLIAELRAQGNAVEALQFSPDGTTLATASGDWTVALWHIDPDDAVRRLCTVAVPAAHADGAKVPQLCS
ncbi:MAG TPA: WD40 repeat domain-containing protein, partial [Planosporangium sp.]|nr:WD40 repeat domain-containing protein [Planosporangium sp.]